jgi:D-alanyl-D-alanine dipeptidase
MTISNPCILKLTNIIMELSGIQWVDQYPTSHSLDDLVSPFKENAKAFYAALIDASASVSIGSTLRPKERAFLMYTAYCIASGVIKPENAPIYPGVDINWTHPSPEASIAAAKAMVDGYHIVHAPAFPTKHSTGTAMDMTVTWAGTIWVAQANQVKKEISTPADNSNPLLQQVAETYGVVKLASDPPHWSDDGR